MKKLLFLTLTLAALFSCKDSKDDDSPLVDDKDRNIELNAGDTYDLKINHGKVWYKFRSDNDYIVSVEPTGEITANTIGEATITITTANKEDAIKVTVKAKYSDNYITLPIIERNSTLEDVKAKETRSIIDEYEGIGEEEGGRYIVIYEDSDAKVKEVKYTFLSNVVNKVTYTMDIEYQENMLDYIGERYIYERVNSGVNYYVNVREAEVVSVQRNDRFDGTFDVVFYNK
ncbi:MAG: Ig-like domain-containing protein [Rikenellaceae bacterium]|nr:Ig-like domain-containing protein [Rikenellaceae bacterium]